jgi:hypothetical protein
LILIGSFIFLGSNLIESNGCHDVQIGVLVSLLAQSDVNAQASACSALATMLNVREVRKSVSNGVRVNGQVMTVADIAELVLRVLQVINFKMQFNLNSDSDIMFLFSFFTFPIFDVPVRSR